MAVINKIKSNSFFNVILKKYRGLLLTIMAFFVLIIVIALSTYFLINRSEKTVNKFELATSQNALLHQLSEDIYDINIYMHDTMQELQRKDVVFVSELPQATVYRVRNIKEQRDTLGQIIEAFNNADAGSKVTFPDGKVIEIDAVTEPHLRAYIKNIDEVWKPYAGVLDDFNDEAQTGLLNAQTVKYMVEYTRLYNHNLRFETSNLQNGISGLITQNTNNVTWVQVIGALLAFILFLVIVFGSIRQLAKADNELAVAQQQTDDIMRTVTEGLLLIDKNLVIADQYSKSAEQIIDKTDLGGKTLLDLLKGVISEKDLTATQLFVEQLYNPWVVEDLIADLNPLRAVKLKSVNEDDELSVKYLDFNFLRVTEKDSDDINKVFVSIVDITKAIELQENLDKQRQQHDRELEMISSILTVDSRHLISFISNTRNRIDTINNVLKSNIDVNTGNLKNKARDLFRHMHSLKGDASALKLNAFVGIAERQESQLKDLLDRPSLKGDDFLPFTIGLNDLLDLVNYISSLLERLKIMGGNIEQKPAEIDAKRWDKYFIDYANEIAKRNNKKVQLILSGFDGWDESMPNFSAYKDIAVQFLKNAIVHGIETPDERLAKGKNETGRISLSMSESNNGLRLAVEDDGQGIDTETIRQKAIDLGYISAEKAKTLPTKSLYVLMFKSGVSTAKEQTEDAGRGVGMDIIYNMVKSGKGKIEVNSKPEQFTLMAVSFPMADKV